MGLFSDYMRLFSDFMGLSSNSLSTNLPSKESNKEYKLTRLEKAAKLESNGEWNELLAFSRQWAEAEPLNFRAWQGIGDSLTELGNVKEAIPMYRKGLEVAPTQQTKLLGVTISASGLWYRLGNAYVKLNENNNAIEAFIEGTRSDPEGAMIWNNLGIAYINTNNPREANNAFRQAINLEPKNSQFLNNLGILYARCGMEEEVANIHGMLTKLDSRAARNFSTHANGYLNECKRKT